MNALVRWQHQTTLAEVLGLDPAGVVADSLRVDVYLGVARWVDSTGAGQERQLSRDEVAAAIKAVL